MEEKEILRLARNRGIALGALFALIWLGWVGTIVWALNKPVQSAPVVCCSRDDAVCRATENSPAKIIEIERGSR